ALERGGMGNTATIPWFASLGYRRNGSGRDDYRLGDEWQINVGSAMPLAGRLEGVLQLNLRHERRGPGAHRRRLRLRQPRPTPRRARAVGGVRLRATAALSGRQRPAAHG